MIIVAMLIGTAIGWALGALWVGLFVDRDESRRGR